MRRFLLFTLILILITTLAGAVAGGFLLYDSHQRQRAHLDIRGTRITDLEGDLDTAGGALITAESDADALERANQALQELIATQESQLATRERQVATLQAEIDRPPIPTPTPPSRPTIFLNSPADGTQFQERDVVIVRWNAVNQDRIGRVTLLVDGRAVAETVIDRLPSAEGEFEWIAVGVGSHQLTVVATNTVGMQGEPATVTIEVLQAPESEPTIEEQNATILDNIGEVVLGLRGLEPLEPVRRTFYSPDDLRTFVVQELEEDYPPEEAQRDVIEMAAFDFLPADTDLSSLLESLYTEQIAGFYDPDEKFLAVVTSEGEIQPLDKSIYAHEFVHALQDQHYDLIALDPEENSGDASLAVTALIEGDAMVVQEQFMLGYMDSDELFALMTELGSVDNSALDSAPAVIREQLMFSYEAGLVFTKALIEHGGYPALNDAFGDPPRSTEQILHPEKYLAGENPELVAIPPLTETLGSEWSWVGEDVLGEFTLRLYLEQQLESRAAADAAAGWGGDRYVVFQNPESGAILMVMRLIWDSEEEAAEFYDAYGTFGESRFGSEPTPGGACWEVDDAICVYQAGRETLLILAPSLELITTLEGIFPEFSP
jgi:hypothetical protein